MKTLREYQISANDISRQKLAAGVKRQLGVMATGLGKTFTAAKRIEDFQKILWVTHTEELIDQSAQAIFIEFYSDLGPNSHINNLGARWQHTIGLIKAESFNLQHKITVASIQTLHRRL